MYLQCYTQSPKISNVIPSTAVNCSPGSSILFVVTFVFRSHLAMLQLHFHSNLSYIFFRSYVLRVYRIAYVATYNIMGFINRRQNVIRPCSSSVPPTHTKNWLSYSTHTNCFVQISSNNILQCYIILIVLKSGYARTCIIILD